MADCLSLVESGAWPLAIPEAPASPIATAKRCDKSHSQPAGEGALLRPGEFQKEKMMRIEWSNHNAKIIMDLLPPLVRKDKFRMLALSFRVSI